MGWRARKWGEDQRSANDIIHIMSLADFLYETGHDRKTVWPAHSGR